MKKITQDEFNKAVELHQKWRNSEDGGERADFSETDLTVIDFSNANLRSANLRYADLRSANLRYADLRSANLVHLKADEYQVYINSETMQIGCKNYTHEEWFTFDDDAIHSMSRADNCIEQWQFWKPILKTICDKLKSNAKSKQKSEEAEKTEA